MHSFLWEKKRRNDLYQQEQKLFHFWTDLSNMSSEHSLAENHRSLSVNSSREAVLLHKRRRGAEIVISQIETELQQWLWNRGLAILFRTAGTCICFCHHPSWLPFPHWSSAWLIKCMKTIFEGQSLKRLLAKGCQDGLFANSPSPWMFSAIWIILHGYKDSCQAYWLDWSWSRWWR